ncbi:Fc.00g106740.m01.CDS01 [Cosmosporella sp. VM-42]
MCTTNIFSYIHADGHKEQTYQPTLCSASRHGQPCSNEVVFQHPPQYIAYGDSAPYVTQLPPTPTYTPRSSTPNYRSGDESDRSFHSSSSSKKRASGLYINGQKVLDLERRERHPSRRERIVLVDNPPTPRTPPQTWTAPHTAPPSPNAYVVDASPREPSRRRPVIVDERTRPHVKLEVVEPHYSKHSHSRHTSTSSRESRQSDDEDRRRRRREKRELEELEIREKKLRARIAEANAEISSRPTVPVPPAPKRASTYKRGTVELRDREAELVDAVRRLDFEEARRDEKARRLAKKEAKKAVEKEEEEQRQRLMERMMPRRRATVGPGSRRHRVLYDDGVYRWE